MVISVISEICHTCTRNLITHTFILQPDAFKLMQIRIQKFLGRIGRHAHFLVPDMNLLQVIGTGGLAWDMTDQVKFTLPFRDDKADISLGEAIKSQKFVKLHVMLALKI